MSKTGAVKIAWLSLAVLIAIPLVVTHNPTANRDNDIVLLYALLALTFPTGFVVTALYALVGYTLEVLFICAVACWTPCDDRRLRGFLNCGIPAMVRCLSLHLDRSKKENNCALIRS